MRPAWLVRTVLELTRSKAAAMSPERRAQLTERRLAECLELLTPRTVTRGDQVARQTGSLAWRLARGEMGGAAPTQWAWQPSAAQLEAGHMTVEYDVVGDRYLASGGPERSGFVSGTWSSAGLARKVEADWNMVYIARLEGAAAGDRGEAEWRFQLPQAVTADRVVVTVDSKTFESGSVR